MDYRTYLRDGHAMSSARPTPDSYNLKGGVLLLPFPVNVNGRSSVIGEGLVVDGGITGGRGGSESLKYVVVQAWIT